MLQIYIHNDNGISGFLDLKAGTVLDFESLQEAFDEELAVGEFSLPIDVEWTDNNRRLLNFAERVENFRRAENFWFCTVYDQGFPELIRVKFTILGKTGNFNYRNGKFSASISGSKGLYGAAIKNKRMTDLALGGVIVWDDMYDSRMFAYQHANGGYPAYPYISFVPVMIDKFFKEDRRDFAGEFLANSTVNNVVITGIGSGWVFGRPQSDNPSVAALDATAEYADYRTVPFFKVQYALKNCFEQFGFSVSGDFINDPDFADLLIFNNFGLEVFRNGLFSDHNRKIVPNNHVPDMLISDWLKALFSTFSIFPVFSDGGEVRIVFHKNDIKVSQVASLDEDITGSFESDTLDGTSTENGYKVAWQWDSADGYYSERVKDLKDKTLVATVATLPDLDFLTIGRPFTTDDIVLVEAENMYYQVADATVFPPKYDAYSENLDEYVKGGGERTIDLAMSTLCQTVQLNPTTALYEVKPYLGCIQNGSYTNFAGALVKSDFGARVFYGGRQLLLATLIPTSYNHNRNPDNTLRCKYSLSIKGDDGLAMQLHQGWLDILENAELVKLPVKYNRKTLQTLRSYNRFQIAGTLFLLKKIERSIPPTSEIKLELVPL